MRSQKCNTNFSKLMRRHGFGLKVAMLRVNCCNMSLVFYEVHLYFVEGLGPRHNVILDGMQLQEAIAT